MKGLRTSRTWAIEAPSTLRRIPTGQHWTRTSLDRPRVVLVPAIPREKLVSSITRQDDLGRAACRARDAVRGNDRRIGERLVELSNHLRQQVVETSRSDIELDVLGA